MSDDDAPSNSDVPEPRPGPDVRLRARLRLLPGGEGRTEPICGPVSYRPVCNFYGPDNLISALGVIDLPAGAVLSPGESLDVDMWFVRFPWPMAELSPGREWRLQEGRRLVGFGVALEILETSASNT